jgi:ribonuclease HI
LYYNQAKYEALMFGLRFVLDAGFPHMKALVHSLLVVQQVSRIFQCNDGFLSAYLDKCLDVVAALDYFLVHHIPRHDNWRASELAQQAS